MDWIQFSLFSIAVVAMYYSLKSDAKEANMRASEDRKELISLNRSIQAEMHAFHAEMKSFHGRLCTLEERYLQILQQKAK